VNFERNADLIGGEDVDFKQGKIPAPGKVEQFVADGLTVFGSGDFLQAAVQEEGMRVPGYGLGGLVEEQEAPLGVGDEDDVGRAFDQGCAASFVFLLAGAGLIGGGAVFQGICHLSVIGHFGVNTSPLAVCIGIIRKNQWAVNRLRG